MNVRHTSPHVEEIRAHISEHRNAYLLGSGILIGICAARLLGQQQVVINNIIQGASHG